MRKERERERAGTFFELERERRERERDENEMRNQCDRSGLRTGAYVCNVCLCAQTSCENSY